MRYCVREQGSDACAYDEDRVEFDAGSSKRVISLTDDYEEAHAEVVKVQLQQAG